MENNIKLYVFIVFFIFYLFFLSGCASNMESTKVDGGSQRDFSLPVKSVYYKEYGSAYILGVKLDLSDIPVGQVYCDYWETLCTAIEGRTIVYVTDKGKNFPDSMGIDFEIFINTPLDKITDKNKWVYFNTSDNILYYYGAMTTFESKSAYRYGNISTSVQNIDFSLMP
jgi:hypothetical protein